MDVDEKLIQKKNKTLLPMKLVQKHNFQQIIRWTEEFSALALN